MLNWCGFWGKGTLLWGKLSLLGDEWSPLRALNACGQILHKIQARVRPPPPFRQCLHFGSIWTGNPSLSLSDIRLCKIFDKYHVRLFERFDQQFCSLPFPNLLIEFCWEESVKEQKTLQWISIDICKNTSLTFFLFHTQDISTAHHTLDDKSKLVRSEKMSEILLNRTVLHVVYVKGIFPSFL